ncbi:MAG: hypothetical protein NT018_07485 [Armatimonadetes bacterium]|nr:hypothetical protein [Armatimonadota bacterium]
MLDSNVSKLNTSITWMQEVAQILATGILRLKHREQDAQRGAANVSEKELDLCSEKSVNVTSRLDKR